jgi:hypothetical protein
VTEITALPDLPLDVAVMVAEPAATPVTTPVVLTLAIAALLDAQETVVLEVPTLATAWMVLPT